MKLNRILDGVLSQVGGESWQQAKTQAAVFKAQQASRTRPNAAANGLTNATANPFLNTLNNLANTSLPIPPADATNAEQLSLYNQQLLQYINRLNAQQAVSGQRLQAQITQLVQALQQSRGNGSTATQNAGNNTQYPNNSQLSSLSGVVNTQPDSLLLDNSANNN